ncbi:MAG TPA: hypothetical protein VKU60_11490 [Chloroflexota bacterium]|nr:hypothetical protein [Chloroflexota bacterium]
MNPDNETELNNLLAHLPDYREDELPDEFRKLAGSMIIPALEEVAGRVKAAGHDCQVDAFVEEPIPPTGQAIYLRFDTRFAPGDNCLCIRLAPGDSIVRIETPGAGTVITQSVPISQLARGNVERVAVEYLRRAMQ